jgi:hypothetical protein
MYLALCRRRPPHADAAPCALEIETNILEAVTVPAGRAAQPFTVAVAQPAVAYPKGSEWARLACQWPKSRDRMGQVDPMRAVPAPKIVFRALFLQGFRHATRPV